MAVAPELPYSEGPVYVVTFVRVTPGLELDYFRHLQSAWKQEHEALKRVGLVRDYKVLSSYAANREDWHVMLMVELENMAALDGIEERVRTVWSTLGTEEQIKDGYMDRARMREMLGRKVVRELRLK